MIKLLCTVYDLKSQVYCDPFIALDENQALSRFAYACSVDYEAELFRFCEDYDLYLLGIFDDVTGEIVLKNKQMESGKNFVQQRNRNRETYYARKLIIEESQHEISNDSSIQSRT